jgi:hypothetical protein
MKERQTRSPSVLIVVIPIVVIPTGLLFEDNIFIKDELLTIVFPHCLKFSEIQSMVCEKISGIAAFLIRNILTTSRTAFT